MKERIQARLARALGVDAAIARVEEHRRAWELERGAWEATAAGRLGTLELRAKIPVVMAAAAAAELRETPLVSVVMATRNRAGILPGALESVRAQTYPEWEVVLVDDGSDDDTAAVVDALGDERIRLLEREHGGAAAARNAGLDAARGRLIAYLDDDNRMEPGWLRTVVWAFERRPDADVVYGGYVIDDVQALNETSGGGLPGLVINEFSRERLADGNPTDMSALAHRAGLEQARFDERLSRLEDWELLARLTAAKDPFVVPAIASHYGTRPEDRLSLEPPDRADLEAVRRACAPTPPPD